MPANIILMQPIGSSEAPTYYNNGLIPEIIDGVLIVITTWKACAILINAEKVYTINCGNFANGQWLTWNKIFPVS